VLRWLWDLFGLAGSIVLLLLTWVDGDLWDLWGIGAMLRLLRGWLLIRRRPLYLGLMGNVRRCSR
jgi:hypothetical protein